MLTLILLLEARKKTWLPSLDLGSLLNLAGGGEVDGRGIVAEGLDAHLDLVTLGTEEDLAALTLALDLVSFLNLARSCCLKHGKRPGHCDTCFQT